MTADGSKVYWLHQRNGWKTATIHGFGFDGTNWSEINGWYNWKLDDTFTLADQRLAILLSADESRVISFSSGFEGSGEKRTDCRMDVWDANDLTDNLYQKANRNIYDRRCRFPAFHVPSSDPDGAVYMVTVLTEYISEDKMGFIQIKLKADYKE